MKIISRRFFARPTLQVARELLGCHLVHVHGGLRLSGLIVETEAYVGMEDQASHARIGPSRRNLPMFGPPGHAYVYFTYGNHWMFNVVTERDGFPAAVLVRALLPREGIEVMRERRARPDPILTDGPGKLTQAMGINGSHDRIDLCRRPDPAVKNGPELFLTRGTSVPEHLVTRGRRVGLGKIPEPWLSIPWRFRILPGHWDRVLAQDCTAGDQAALPPGSASLTVS